MFRNLFLPLWQLLSVVTRFLYRLLGVPAGQGKPAGASILQSPVSPNAGVVTTPLRTVAIPVFTAYERRRKTLILDLDETLVHSTIYPTHECDFNVSVEIDGNMFVFYVFKRPHVDFFLKKVSTWFKVVIFTASLRSYAEPVIQKLDKYKSASAHYFRESCTPLENGAFVKDLTRNGFDASSTIIIDNSPVAYSANKDSAIPIDNFLGNKTKNDEALLDLLPFLNALRLLADVRSILSLRTRT
mmetsp:Transcript_48269/g.121508  ORF Transcript_48269/g.121508 Transcript_48269/m.121508 type:complete len:243 (-) Transcript_48269:142-870(-)